MTILDGLTVLDEVQTVYLFHFLCMFLLISCRPIVVSPMPPSLALDELHAYRSFAVVL